MPSSHLSLPVRQGEHKQFIPLDCGRCKAPAPEYFYFLHIFRKKFLFSHNFIAKQKKKKYIDNIAKQL